MAFNNKQTTRLPENLNVSFVDLPPQGTNIFMSGEASSSAFRSDICVSGGRQSAPLRLIVKLKFKNFAAIKMPPAASTGGGDRTKKKKKPNLNNPSPLVTVKVEDYPGTFNGGFSEGQTQAMTLKETNPETFGIFCTWVYTQNLMDERNNQVGLLDLIWLWIFGDKYFIPKLQNQVIDDLNLRRVQDNLSFTRSFEFLYENTTEESLLRKYCNDVCATIQRSTSINYAYYPRELLVSLDETLRQGGAKQWRVFSREERKKYYVLEEV